MTKGIDSFSRAFYFLLKYRLHISIFSLILLVQFYNSYLHLKPDWAVIITFFIWNFALYLFDRAYDAEKDSISQRMEAIATVEKKPLIAFTILLSIVPVFILGIAHKPILPYLFFIPLTFIYTYPVIGTKRLKDFLFIKNFYSGFFIWCLPIVIICAFYTNGVDIDFKSLAVKQLFPLFLYVMIGEAFWDIRDVEGDRINGVNTIPVLFDVNATKIYLYSLLLIDLVTNGFHASEPLLIYTILIFIVKPTSQRWIFHIPPLIALLRWFLSLHSS